MKQRAMALAVLVLALSACGGGDDDSKGGASDGSPGNKSGCLDRFDTPGTEFSGICTICGDTQNARAAYDGSRDSYATLQTSTHSDVGLGVATVALSGDNSWVIRVQAPAGISFPAGEPVGAILRLAEGGTPTVQAVTVGTYLGGTPQEQFGGDAPVSPAQAVEDRAYTYSSTKAYDAVELTVHFSRPATLEESPAIRIYEFCG